MNCLQCLAILQTGWGVSVSNGLLCKSRYQQKKKLLNKDLTAETRASITDTDCWLLLNCKTLGNSRWNISDESGTNKCLKDMLDPYKKNQVKLNIKLFYLLFILKLSLQFLQTYYQNLGYIEIVLNSDLWGFMIV